jgi:hypothetical protein
MLTDKVHRIRVEVEAARLETAPGPSRQGLIVTSEVVPGVRLVLSKVGGLSLAFSLWQSLDDIVELSNDAALPASSLLLAIDEDQLRSATAAGRTLAVDLLSASRSHPELRFAVMHYGGRREIRRVLHRLVLPPMPSTAAA